jgi:hypothetical protein
MLEAETRQLGSFARFSKSSAQAAIKVNWNEEEFA